MEAVINDSLSVLAHNQLESKFAKVRAQGWASFQKQGWPNRRNEEYKFTSLDQLITKKFDFNNIKALKELDSSSVQSKFYQIEGFHLVFINGDFSKDFSSIPSSEVSIRTFEELSPSEIEEIIAKPKDDRATVAINQAFVGNGIVVHVPKSANPLPLFIYHINASANSSMSFPRIHMIAEENAHIRCYERTFNLSEAHFSSSVQTFDVARHASIRFTKIQDFGKNDMILDNLFVNQAADSHFFANTFSFSGALIRNNLEIDINGEHAEANMYGLYLLDGHSHVDNHTVVDHKVANCNSNEMYKGIVDEQSTAVFNGKIFVRQPAQKTNAFQANNNVSLSDQATIHTKPQLEIWADDVKCSHGCTIGQLDEEALFYLQSRGIRPSAAKAMLLNAFAEQALVNIQQDEVKNEIITLIHNRLDV